MVRHAKSWACKRALGDPKAADASLPNEGVELRECPQWVESRRPASSQGLHKRPTSTAKGMAGRERKRKPPQRVESRLAAKVGKRTSPPCYWSKGFQPSSTVQAHEIIRFDGSLDRDLRVLRGFLFTFRLRKSSQGIVNLLDEVRDAIDRDAIIGHLGRHDLRCQLHQSFIHHRFPFATEVRSLHAVRKPNTEGCLATRLSGT